MRNVKLLLIIFLCIFSLSACAGLQPKPEFQITGGYQHFAEGPDSRCWVYANDAYVAICSGTYRWSKRISDVYDAENLSKIDTVYNEEDLERKYGLNDSQKWLGTLSDHFQNFKSIVSDGTAHIRYSGLSEEYTVNAPEGFSHIESVLKIGDKHLIVAFVEQGSMAQSNTAELKICRYDLTTTLPSPQVIHNEQLPRLKRSAVGKVFSLLLAAQGSTGHAQQWHSKVSLVPADNGQNFYLGMSSFLQGCSSDRCEYFDGNSSLRILDLNGKILGDLKSNDEYTFVSYGNLTKVGKLLFASKEPYTYSFEGKNIKSGHFLINPETGVLTEPPNPDFIVSVSKQNLIYSSDSKNFYSKSPVSE